MRALFLRVTSLHLALRNRLLLRTYRQEQAILHPLQIRRLERFLWPLEVILFVWPRLPCSIQVVLLCHLLFQYSCAPISLFMIHISCLILVVFPVVITLGFVPHFLEAGSNDSPPSCHFSDM